MLANAGGASSRPAIVRLLRSSCSGLIADTASSVTKLHPSRKTTKYTKYTKTTKAGLPRITPIHANGHASHIRNLALYSLLATRYSLLPGENSEPQTPNSRAPQPKTQNPKLPPSPPPLTPHRPPPDWGLVSDRRMTSSTFQTSISSPLSAGHFRAEPHTAPSSAKDRRTIQVPCCRHRP